MKLIERPSPNFDARTRAIDAVILHYTGMESGEAAIARLCDAAAQVSAHYVVEEDGRIFRLVAEDQRASHAGVSSWRGEAEINARSIGIEIVNPGHEWGYRDFPRAQIESVVALLKSIRDRWNIAPARVLGHSDVVPLRKEDPGERFPWKRLAAEGLAIPPYDGAPDPTLPYDEAVSLLRVIGYEVPDVAPGRPGPAAAVLAFQRRFCPVALGQGINPLTKAAIRHTASLVAE